MSERDPEKPLHQDPAAPHTMPAPKHVPRWIAWLVLAALAAAGLVCARSLISI
jgi:hypothetical protein